MVEGGGVGALGMVGAVAGGGWAFNLQVGQGDGRGVL